MGKVYKQKFWNAEVNFLVLGANFLAKHELTIDIKRRVLKTYGGEVVIKAMMNKNCPPPSRAIGQRK